MGSTVTPFTSPMFPYCHCKFVVVATNTITVSVKISNPTRCAYTYNILKPVIMNSVDVKGSDCTDLLWLVHGT